MTSPPNESQRSQFGRPDGSTGFWDNPEKARQLIALLKPLNGLLNPFEDLQKSADDIHTLAELAEEDAGLEEELARTAQGGKTTRRLEFAAVFSGSQDASNATCGPFKRAPEAPRLAIGAEMLMRMYIRWAERQRL